MRPRLAAIRHSWWRRLISTLLDDGYARINSTYQRAVGRREVVKAAGHCKVSAKFGD
jgi:hypothetical protein